MNLEDIGNKVATLGNAWEEFKSANDARLKEIEKKGAADPLLIGKVDKLSSFMDETKSALDEARKSNDELRAAINRAPSVTETKDKKVAEQREAFISYVRKGIISDALAPDMEGKALSVQSDPDGGYLVSPTVSSQINTAIFETSPIRQICTVETISTDSLDIMDDANAATGGWTAETAQITETNTPQIGKRNIPTHEIYAQPKATSKLLDDASVDVEAWLGGKIADILARTQNTAFVSGSGVGQPRGFLTYAAGSSWGQIEQVTSGSSGAVTADGLIGLYYALKSDYSRNGTFLMNRLVVKAARLLKDTTNQYLWQPSMQAGQPDSLLGAPVLMASDMPTAASNSLSVAFGDFKRAYTVVDRRGIRTLRDPFTEKPFVKFYATARVGGDVTNFEAIKLLKLA